MADEIELLKQGDQYAWESLVERLSPRLFALFGSMLGLDSTRSRELVAEVFYRAFSGIGSFRGRSKIDTWIYAIATNIARDYIRKRQKEEMFVPMDRTYGDYTPEDELDRELLLSALAEIPPAYQRALTLYFLNNHKYDEIAEIMGVPLGTVKTLIHRGKKMLRQKYLNRTKRG